MIESVELVVAALAGGAAAGARESSSTALKEAYSGVKTLALRALRRAQSVLPAVVEAVEADAVTLADDERGGAWRRELTAALTAADAGADDELVTAALQVLELTDPAGTQSGKYRVLLQNYKGVPVGDLSLPEDQIPHDIHNSQGVQVGTGNIQHNYYSKAPQPAMELTPALSSLSRIPPEPAVFVGRSGELRQLKKVLSTAGRAAVVAVHGLGGVGKSALAAQFAHLNADRFGFRWWLTADSPTAIDTGLAALAVALAPATAELPMEQRTDLGIRWLATHDGWLLVLDNVVSPDHTSSLLERVRTGTVLMTSRQAVGWGKVTSVRVDVLSHAEAIDLLARTVQAEWPDADLTDIERLCDELGYLPLAVEQAAAYLAQTRISPTAYLDLLARYPARLYTATREGGDAQRTVARVWQVTLNQLSTTPLSGQFLCQLAWYAPDNIPRTWLAVNADEPDVLHALGRLAAYSMITLNRETISVHRLVQAVARTPRPEDPHHQLADITAAQATAVATLVAAVADSHPRDPDDWPAYEAVLPHAAATFRFTSPDEYTPDHATLLNEIGYYLLKQGSFDAAIKYFSRARQTRFTHFGADHGATLTSSSNLAHAYQAAGNLDRAIPLFEEALIDSERIFGSDHPGTLTVRNSLGYAYHAIRDLDRAIPLYETALADRQRILGPKHPDTLISRSNLASAYQHAGDLERAISLHEATLRDSEEVLGPKHPSTLISRGNLAYMYQKVGAFEQATLLHEATLRDSEEVLGQDHPDTVASRGNLASVYQEAGDLARAVTLYEATLRDGEEVLGPKHPDTLLCRNNLAGVYKAMGDLARAIPLYEATLIDSEQALGPDHWLTNIIRDNLQEIAQAG
ncbi:FxSxx-COOH system tetratricopeptide repeat protein [Amycolatopsis sp. FBCC-B4732]|uniref:FxSxx-COOH system tetratricopeptide repeat protein n=1 Tax=Amycolatopsis sp. FBCC-B4732 TaxID=3079339 RepID=UPI001FF23B4A|nr:FxSxx-COOH system tetratricopeptide repeat protein [Amycolatopsis sp. FBCC-B4732]UOX90351.1 FxSxx-COOH system tetratricopeptide repeat protein [Amycolatopsis sp. FBCC-B4732]